MGMRAGRLVIALVDDDPLFRVPIAQGLDMAGYTVVCAANGTDAISLLEDPDIDVAVIDVKLVGRMNGVEALREARRSNPGLKAILISGRRPADGESDPDDIFLAKPFRIGDLLATISKALGIAVPIDGVQRRPGAA